MAMEHWIEGQRQQGNALAAKFGDFALEQFGEIPLHIQRSELATILTHNEDMPIVFGCSEDQIAHSISQIRPDTKAYVGPLESGIFDKLPKDLEHVYTTFPEGKIRRQTIEIGGKTAETLEAELAQADINISSYARDMLHSRDFTTLNEPQALDIVRLRVQDLGLTGIPTTDQVYARAEELGLELCPAEVGPHLILIDTNQPLRDWNCIGMRQITASSGSPGLFRLDRDGGWLWLDGGWAEPGRGWLPAHEFVFSLRK